MWASRPEHSNKARSPSSTPVTTRSASSSSQQGAGDRGWLRFRDHWRACECVRGTAPGQFYLPPHSAATIAAAVRLRAGVVLGAGKRQVQGARDQSRAMSGTLTRGTGSNARHVRNVLPEEAEAESVLVVEIITPGGHWSSYPPHKHDRDALPDESYLEETYYHRLKPPQGFAFQRHLHRRPFARRNASGE